MLEAFRCALAAGADRICFSDTVGVLEPEETRRKAELIRNTFPDATVELVNELARRRVTHVVISFGNPYLISLFPDARAYLLAWSSAQVSQEAASDALFGAIPIRGRSPTGMDPFFAVGDGIQIPLGASRGR